MSPFARLLRQISGPLGPDHLLGACFQAIAQFRFDLWHEVIDHVLQNKLRRGAQFMVEMTLGQRAKRSSHGRLSRFGLNLGRRYRGSPDDVGKHGNAVRVQGVVEQGWILIAEQCPDGLEIVEQMSFMGRCLRHVRWVPEIEASRQVVLLQKWTGVR